LELKHILIIFKPFGFGLVVLAWDLGVCSSQGLRFDSPWWQLRWALTLNEAPASGRWDWTPRISRFLGRIPSLYKTHFKVPFLILSCFWKYIDTLAICDLDVFTLTTFVAESIVELSVEVVICCLNLLWQVYCGFVRLWPERLISLVVTFWLGILLCCSVQIIGELQWRGWVNLMNVLWFHRSCWKATYLNLCCIVSCLRLCWFWCILVCCGLFFFMVDLVLLVRMNGAGIRFS